MLNLPNACLACKHFQPKEQYDGLTGSCSAFADGIPDGIWNGAVAHFDPVADEPVVFEMRPGAEPILDSYLQYWFGSLANGPEPTEQ